MTRRFRLPILLLYILVAGATSAGSLSAQAASRAALRRELDAETRKLELAFARGDLLAVARTYADDAQMIPPSGHAPKTGRAAIDRYWTRIDHPRSWTLETLDWGGTAEEAWQLVRSTMVAGEKNPPPHSVRCLLIWRRQPDGSRRIHLDIWTESVKRSS